MSYISAIRRRDEVYVWERTNKGRELVTYPAPYYFYTKDPSGEYTSLYGDKLVRHDFDTSAEMAAARGECQGQRLQMFESDIPPELKVLSEHYYGVEAPELFVTFLDIEVDYKREIGFSSVNNPYAEINSVALHHAWLNKHILLIVPPPGYDGPTTEKEFKEALNGVEPLPEDHEVEVIFCQNEVDLLFNLLVEIEESDVLCGWNSDFFDIPYIGKRLQTVLGDKYFRMLSFPEAPAPRWRTVEKFNVEQTLLDPEGRIGVDYLELFKKYEVSERPSYKLETISEEVLPEMRKLEYEGSLADLYVNNFVHFVRYNLRDTEILRGFEDKLGYVKLANEMYHMSTGLMKHVTGTIKLAELATNNFCHYERDVRVPDLDVDEDRQSIQGAYVLMPQVGMHEWVGSMDINSLYPSAIRSINISPETIVGQFQENVRAWEEITKRSFVSLVLYYDNGDEEEHTADEWYDILKERKWSISGYGTIFDQHEKGIVPAILEDWYARRKQFQKQSKTSDDKEEAAYYDRIQFVYKIKLNSFYGALTNAFFRFYDLRMGESTTGTGRAILRHMCAQACAELDGEYTLPNKEGEREGRKDVGYTSDKSVVYGDTDSAYFLTHAQNKEEAILIADTVAERVNGTFQSFMQQNFLCNPGFDDIIKAGREIVSSRGLFVDKKRYVLHIVDDEGKEVDKLKVMGLDTKKTTLPKPISDQLNKFIERLLKGESWDSIAEDIVEYKEQLRTTDDIMAIGLPKGIKGIEEYTENLRIYGDGQRLPGHIAAAIHYNQCVDKFNDKDNVEISTGMKIKVFYLTKKYGRFKSIALPTDTTTVPEWFIEHFTIDRDAHLERLVDNPLRNIIKSIGYDVPSKQSLLVDSLLDF
jgi:DNA polymerase elongation subunit (family B)